MWTGEETGISGANEYYKNHKVGIVSYWYPHNVKDKFQVFGVINMFIHWFIETIITMFNLNMIRYGYAWTTGLH